MSERDALRAKRQKQLEIKQFETAQLRNEMDIEDAERRLESLKVSQVELEGKLAQAREELTAMEQNNG